MNAAELARHQLAMRRLAQIPGVVRVGFGLKQTGGQLVPGAPAYRVYVAHKRSLDEVPVDERIPLEVDGIKTDVLYADQKQLHTKTPSIAPGDQITRWIPNDFQAGGTLGLIVRRGSDRFILTNDHVLDDHHNQYDLARDVYDPYIKTCAGLHCNNPVARVIDDTGVRGPRVEPDGNSYYIDCTLASVNSGVDAANNYPGIGALDQGVVDLATRGTAALGTVVKKNGSTTGLTVGTVAQMFEVQPDGSTSWELRITPTSGHSYSGQWELASTEDPAAVRGRFTGGVHATIDSSGGRNVLRVSGMVWSLPGDSGSAVVDEQRHVVGLHHAGYRTTIRAMVDGSAQDVDVQLGDGGEAYILPVFHALNLDPATAIIPPGSPSSGVAIEVPGPHVMHGSWAAAERGLREIEAAAAQTEAGRRLLTLVQRHYPAIAHLVHHRRRVTVVWHRNRGPAFAAALLQALRRPGSPLPIQLSGVRLVDALQAFRDALLAEGGAELAKAVQAESELVLRLAERATSVEALLEALREAS